MAVLYIKIIRPISYDISPLSIKLSKIQIRRLRSEHNDEEFKLLWYLEVFVCRTDLVIKCRGEKPFTVPD